MPGIVAGVFQRLHEQCLVDILHIGGELTHLESLSCIGVFKGHSQHLVGLQCALQRHIAQSLVHRIFRAVEQSCLFQFLIVGSAYKSTDTIEHAARLVDVSRSGIHAHHRRILVVGIVVGHGFSCHTPYRVRHTDVLTKVGECHKITCISGCSCLVGHPDFHTVDGHAGGHVGQGFHGIVIFVAKILRQEEVAVFLIVGHIDFKGGELHAALGRHAL